MAKKTIRKKSKKITHRATKPLPGTKAGTMNGFEMRRMKVSDIQTASYNPRAITESALSGLKASTERFGLVQPIIVNKRTGNVVGGHQRLSTLDPASETDVVIVDLSESEEKALNATLNNPATQGHWTKDLSELLSQVSTEIPELSTDLNLDDLFAAVSLGGGTPYVIEVVEVESLTPHPRNYRNHPEDQLDQISKSIEQHGFYRNVAVARDGTILAGHGVIQAAKKMGLQKIPVRRIDIDPSDPKALKLIAGDNELARFAFVDDRELANLLKDVLELDDEGLEGTGFDEKMLANLIMVSRPASEIKNMDEAAEWIGLPDYEPERVSVKLTVNFDNEEDRDKFIAQLGLRTEKGKKSAWWPVRPRQDLAAVEFDG